MHRRIHDRYNEREGRVEWGGERKRGVVGPKPVGAGVPPSGRRGETNGGRSLWFWAGVSPLSGCRRAAHEVSVKGRTPPLTDTLLTFQTHRHAKEKHSKLNGHRKLYYRIVFL